MPETTPARPAATTVLAFDFGLRRIGIAIGQSVTGTASPLGVVDNSGSGPDHDRIGQLITEWQPDRLIVGMPMGHDGNAGDLETPIRAFIEDLMRYERPVTIVDESATSQEAEAALKAARQRGSRGRIGKSDIDAAAAVKIAERYLATIAG